MVPYKFNIEPYGNIFLKISHISQSFDKKFSCLAVFLCIDLKSNMVATIGRSYNKGVHEKMKKEISQTFENRLN